MYNLIYLNERTIKNNQTEIMLLMKLEGQLKKIIVKKYIYIYTYKNASTILQMKKGDN